MSHRCLSNELQRYPVLRKAMDEVIGKFLRENLQPAESMITHIIYMEVWNSCNIFPFVFFLCFWGMKSLCVKCIRKNTNSKKLVCPLFHYLPHPFKLGKDCGLRTAHIEGFIFLLDICFPIMVWCDKVECEYYQYKGSIYVYMWAQVSP